MQHQFLLPTIADSGAGNRAPVARRHSPKLLIYKLTEETKMFVNACFGFRFVFLFFVVAAETSRLWQEADVCVSAKMLRKSGTVGA